VKIFLAIAGILIFANSTGASGNFYPGQIISCRDIKENRNLQIRILDTKRQTAHLQYSSGGAPIFDAEGAYARSGAGTDFAVVLEGRPLFSMLLDLDQVTVHVPRNGARIPCAP
jgi:hypothetical protein